MFFDLAELQKFSQEVIKPTIEELIRKTPFAYNLFSKDTDINARGTFLIARVEDNPSVKWFQEGGIYAVGNRSEAIKMNFTHSRLSGTAQITGDALDASDTRVVGRVIANEVVSTFNSLMRELSEQIYGDGSGVKAVTDGNVSAGTIVAFYNSVTYTSTVNPSSARTVGTWHIRRRARYNWISGNTSTRSGYGGSSFAVGTVLPITSTGNVSTCDVINNGYQATFDVVPATLLPGDMLVYEDSYNLCINGLEYHISSGTGMYQGVSRLTYPQLRCYVVDAGAAHLTVAHLYRLINLMQYNRRLNPTESSGYKLLSGVSQIHRYSLLGDISMAISGNTGLNQMPGGGELDYGFKTFKFAGLDWIVDVDCPDHVVYLINFDKFRIFELKPLSEVFDGSGWRHVPAFVGSYGTYADKLVYPITWKGQLASSNPQAGGAKITNLSTNNLVGAGHGYSFTV